MRCKRPPSSGRFFYLPHTFIPARDTIFGEDDLPELRSARAENACAGEKMIFPHSIKTFIMNRNILRLITPDSYISFLEELGHERSSGCHMSLVYISHQNFSQITLP